MRAIITGTPIELDGEPAEIAQLAELLISGAVVTEHVHRWRGPTAADENGAYQATCWCGQEKLLQPFTGEYDRANWTVGSVDSENARKAATAYVANKRPCGCGPKGKHLKTCRGVVTQLDEAAS